MDDGNIANRLDWALRTGLVVLLVAVSRSLIRTELPSFTTFVSVLALDRNVGRTVANIRACVLGSSISALLCAFWLHWLRRYIVPMHVAHAASVFLLARWASLPTLGQKVGLSMLPFVLINGFNPGERQDLMFALELWLMVLLGCGCAAMAILVPVPHLGPELGFRMASARRRLVNSRDASLELLALLLQSLVRAFCADPSGKHWRSRVRREAMGQALRKEAEHIRTRAADAEWEKLLGWLHCGRDPGYAFNDESMAAALTGAVDGLTVAEEAIVDHASIEGVDEYISFLDSPVNASLDAVASLLDALKRGSPRRLAKDPNAAETRSQQINKACQACLEAQRSLQGQYRDTRHEMRRKEVLRKKEASHDLLLSMNAFLFYYAHVIDLIMRTAKDAVRAEEAPRRSVSGRCLCGTWRACNKVMEELCGAFRTANLRRDLRLETKESQHAAKMMLAMGLAAIFDATKGQEDPPPALAAYTVAYVGLSPTLSGSVRLAKLRLGGTVAGGIFASVALGLPRIRDNREVLIALLCVFAVVAGYVRSSVTSSYAGTVAAYTAPALMLSFNDPSTRIEHTFVGIVIFVTVDLILFNKPSADKAQERLRDALHRLEDGVCLLFAGFGPESRGGPSKGGDAARESTARKEPVLTSPGHAKEACSEDGQSQGAPEGTFPVPAGSPASATDLKTPEDEWAVQEQRDAGRLLYEAAVASHRKQHSGDKGSSGPGFKRQQLRVRARELLSQVAQDVDVLAELIDAAGNEPRFLRACFPTKYMTRANGRVRDVQANLSLALAAYAALERRRLNSRDESHLDSESEATTLTTGLRVREDEDPSFRGFYRSLSGPVAVFVAELTVSLRAAAIDGDLLSQDHPTPGGYSDRERELSAYCFDKSLSEGRFLHDYDRVCNQLEPQCDSQPTSPYISNVEIEAVNAIVFCFMEAMRASERLQTALGQIGEYDFLYSRQSLEQRHGLLDRCRLLDFTHRLLSAMHFLAPQAPPRPPTTDFEMGADVECHNLRHWALRRQARLQRAEKSSSPDAAK